MIAQTAGGAMGMPARMKDEERGISAVLVPACLIVILGEGA